MADIYEVYKPFRNHLRPLHTIDSLAVVHAYSQHLQFSNPMPSTIEVHPEFLHARDWHGKKIFLWELELLAREVIANGVTGASATQSLRRWKYFSATINKLKELENDIVGHYPPGRIMIEFNRIAHRQFPWQMQFGLRDLQRYYRIFKHAQLGEIVKREIGMSAGVLFGVGLGFTGHFLEQFRMVWPPTIRLRQVKRSDTETFKNHFSVSIDAIHVQIKENKKYSVDFVYAFNPLRKYPLISTTYGAKTFLICPMPGLLMYRFTQGLYYELVGKEGFDQAFGDSFQDYVGEVIKRTIVRPTIQLLSEATYFQGKNKKQSVDWAIIKGKTAIFVECKTKRMSINARTSLSMDDYLAQELEKLAYMVAQVYKTIEDCLEGLYPHIAYDPKRQIYPVIVTLEDWFLMGGDVKKSFSDSLDKIMEQEKVPMTYLSDYPFVICSMREFEMLTCVMREVDWKDIFRRKASEPYCDWTMATFLSTEFKQFAKAKELFPDDMDEIERMVK